MVGRNALVLLAAVLPLASALAPPLRRALKAAKPLVVELLVEDAGSAWELDVEDLSARLRTAGAAALIAPRPLLGAFAAEQAKVRARGLEKDTEHVQRSCTRSRDRSSRVHPRRDRKRPLLRAAKRPRASRLGAQLHPAKIPGVPIVVVSNLTSEPLSPLPRRLWKSATA